jgi:hypothetical protein
MPARGESVSNLRQSLCKPRVVAALRVSMVVVVEEEEEEEVE